MSTVDPRRLVQKLWNYCDVLRDDGVSTIDYVEQLTFLLFLKMADERATRKLRPEQIVPDELSWQTLLDAEGPTLEVQYKHILTELGKQGGTLGTIFRKAQNKIQDPAKLKRLIVDLIGKENWSQAGVDVKGDAYEELLAKGAEDAKSGAGQYFTPRALTAAMVDCMLPTPDDTITDPACGTGGFLLAAFEHIQQHHGSTLTPDQRRKLANGAITGTELVDGTARLAAMNMLLHGIGTPGGESLIAIENALGREPSRRYSLVLANPPFGRSSSIKMVGQDGRAADRGDGAIERPDFWTTTANKQLNFVQHIASMLEIDGRAAVVLPDNVLFEGGAGETIRRRLLKQYDLHTMLRLPTGIFYAGGVKANVLFFERKRAREEPWTTKLWVYDFRTNEHFTLKQNPLRREHLDDFVDCYLPGKDRAERVETERFKAFTYDELIARDKVNLDITWLKDASLEDADVLPPPEVIAQEIVEDLQTALREFAAIAEALASSGPSFHDNVRSGD
ncbi:N-6 DNA methylase [Micromonospora echinospora]|uniref:type I restriction-modification system subunit M n=1 Tax=Micromonospora echinospora TaxID=1877 RepID=UPI00366F3B91